MKGLSTILGLASPIGLGVVALLGLLIAVRDVFIIDGSARALVCLLGFAVPSLIRKLHVIRGAQVLHHETVLDT